MEPSVDGEATADFGQGSNNVSTTSDRSGILFDGVTYKVKIGLIKPTTKTILDDVSGIMPPGLNAIMGPTGSGKTSLLDILAGRKNQKGVQGTVLVNGEPQPRNFKCMSGYVVQDDVVMGTLTVKENLFFSAALRLPTSMSWKEKKQRVKKIIDELGLNDCTDTKVRVCTVDIRRFLNDCYSTIVYMKFGDHKEQSSVIGNQFFRGVSGGERKRTNIGMELIIEPKVLFLDEPTTGLDAFTAVATVQLLKHLSNGNRTIIMSIHQPRYAIYKFFDSLTLLSKGQLVYHGAAGSKSLDYFSSLGYNCEEHDNPADFLLDVINKCEGQKLLTTSNLAIEEGGQDMTIDLGKSYLQSKEREDVMKKCEGVIANQQPTPRVNYSNFSNLFTRVSYTTNFFWQLLIVLIRSVVNLARNPMTSVLQYVITIIFGIVVGAVYFQLDNGQNGYQNRVGAIFFIIMNQIFGNLSAIDLFVEQKALFIHENVSGYYRVSTYFIAKVTCDMLITRLFPLCFFSVIAYFMLGFQVDAGKFFIFFLTLFLTAFGASSIAFWVSAGVRVAGIGNLLTALSFVFQMLFGGFFITLDSLPIYLRWLQYLSIFRYSVEALTVNEVDGLQFNQTINGEYVLVNGTDILESQGFRVDWLWYDLIGLAGLCLLFLTLGYITLRAIKKEK